MKTCNRCEKTKSLDSFYKRPGGYYSLCKDCKQNSNLNWKTKNPEKAKQVRQQYLKNSKDSRKEYNRAYMKMKRANDLLFKLANNIRIWTNRAIKHADISKTQKAHYYLGCDTITLKQHLESQFKLGMSWQNYGTWHVDHKIPLSLAKNENDLIKLCSYKNLQPLWAFDNLSKGNKYG